MIDAKDYNLKERMAMGAKIAASLSLFCYTKELLLSPNDDLICDNLIIDKSIYFTLKEKRPDLLYYLIPWTKNSRIIERKNNIRILFPLQDGAETEITVNYSLKEDVMGNFWFHKLYTKTPDFENFHQLESFGGCVFDYQLPGSRGTVDDGQLKIVVDAVLAVDALEEKRNVEILVLGSSAELGNLSGLAYDVVGTMVIESHIDLYDPYTVNCVYEDENKNVYTHKAEKFEYKPIVADLVLDDVWLSHQTHEQIDPNDFAFQVSNYSIKRLPWDKEREKTYQQLFKTTNYEERSVSRNSDYEFREISYLGRCYACTELKYLLKGDYSRKFYQMIMNAHKVNCKTGQHRSISDYGVIDLSCRKVIIKDLTVLSNFYKLPWDIDLNLRIVPANLELIRHSDVAVTDEKLLSNYVIANARSILIMKLGEYHYYGDYYTFEEERATKVEFEVVKGQIINYNAYLDVIRKSALISKDRTESQSLSIIYVKTDYFAQVEKEKNNMIEDILINVRGYGLCFKIQGGVELFYRYNINDDLVYLEKFKLRYADKQKYRVVYLSHIFDYDDFMIYDKERDKVEKIKFEKSKHNFNNYNKKNKNKSYVIKK